MDEEQKKNVEHPEGVRDDHVRSPEKKRVKPATPTTKSIPISENHNDGASSSRASDEQHSLKTSIPLWVAGSSPAKFVSLEDLIKVNDSIEKMAIVHQIAIDPKFKVEDLKSEDPIYQKVKSTMHNAYWDLLRKDLSEDPPKNEHAFSLLEDLKEMIVEHLETSNLKNTLSAVEEALDLDHLRQMLERGVLKFDVVLNSVLSILERLCAPVRDELVAKLKEEKDTVELFRGIFNLVELMKLDMANYALSQNRQLIGSYSAKIEFDEFMKLLEIDKTAADNTKMWLRKILTEFLEQRDIDGDAERPELTRSDVNELIVEFYLKLLISNSTKDSNRPPFPETMQLDAQRIEALAEKLLQLELTIASIFVTCNLLGKAYCGEGTETNKFKAELKRDLLVILNDINWENYKEKLENLALQCDKRCKELVERQNGQWTEAQSKILKQQLLGFSDVHESIRLIARNRIRDFIYQALRQSSEPLRIPPGLGIIQTELASLTSKYYTIAVHNWNSFGRFYGKILDQEYEDLRKRKKADAMKLE